VVLLAFFAVFYVIGSMLAVVAGALLVPTVVAMAFDETVGIVVFAVSAVIIAFVAGGMILAFRSHRVFLRRRDNLLLLLLIWTVVPVAAALPFYFSAVVPDAASAYFEAVSGFTTTGASVMQDLHEVPRSIIVWRAILQWLGGLVTLFGLAYILAPLIVPGLIDRQLETFSSAQDTGNISIWAARDLLPLYVGLTLLCITALLIAGMDTFDAFCLSLSTISTGGFMPRDGSIELYGNLSINIVISIFMFLGSVSFLWLKAIMEGRWRVVRSAREPYWLAIYITGLSVILAIVLVGSASEYTMRQTAYDIIISVASITSIVTTSGFVISSRTSELIPYSLVIILCLVGAGRFSTAGGLKHFMIAAMLRQSWREVRKLIYPNIVRPSYLAGQGHDDDFMQDVWTNFMTVILLLCIITVVLSIFEVGLEDAILAAISAVSNAGPVYDIFATSAAHTSYADMTIISKFMLCVGMIAGRIEILVILSLFSTTYWR
jgi:trk system potassium uptake protein TrkH